MAFKTSELPSQSENKNKNVHQFTFIFTQSTPKLCFSLYVWLKCHLDQIKLRRNNIGGLKHSQSFQYSDKCTQFKNALNPTLTPLHSTQSECYIYKAMFVTKVNQIINATNQHQQHLQQQIKLLIHLFNFNVLCNYNSFYISFLIFLSKVTNSQIKTIQSIL